VHRLSFGLPGFQHLQSVLEELKGLPRIIGGAIVNPLNEVLCFSFLSGSLLDNEVHFKHVLIIFCLCLQYGISSGRRVPSIGAVIPQGNGGLELLCRNPGITVRIKTLPMN
jgi:hypothetical protein